MYEVLVVDNDREVHFLTKAALQDCEFNGKRLSIHCVDGGNEAVEYMRENPQTALILMDVVMQATGTDAIARIRNELQNAQVRIIARTGNPRLAPEKELLDNPFIDGYVPKLIGANHQLVLVARAALKSFDELKKLTDLRALLGKIGSELHSSDSSESKLNTISGLLASQLD